MKAIAEKFQAWENEPDLVEFEAFGYKCSVKRSYHMGHLNGYVEVEDNHPFYFLREEKVPVEVHGGLTFKKDGKFGFDCGHFDDFCPKISEDILRVGGSTSFMNPENYKDIGWVINQTYKLARQFKAAELKERNDGEDL